MQLVLRELGRRLRDRDDSEHEQAVLRIVIVAVVLMYMGLTYRPNAIGVGHGELALLQGLTADVVFAIGIFVHICFRPASNVTRRLVGMLSDAGAATFCMFLAGEAGVSMIGVYLFVTFGNGFRYGRNYLFASQVLCLAGFAVVLAYAPYWERHQVAGWGLLTALLVLPLYVSTLLKRIQEARARAEEANRAKSSFLANMSHEMRTPLNGIVGVADLLHTTNLNAEQAEMMRLLRHSVTLLRSLVDDVLDISKIEAGRLSIESIDFDLHGVLNGLIRLLRPHAAAKGLAFRALMDPAIDYNLRGDPHHLRQVLVNLLSNAIKFTSRGEIELSCILLRESAEGPLVRFAIKDTGIGISEEAQKHIFEQFVQADDSTTRRYGGSGLGTTIAKQLVELMGGVLGIDSKLGEGSTFWFEISLLKAVGDPAAVLPAGSPQASAQGVSILVIGTLPDQRLCSVVASTCGSVESVVSAAEVMPRLNSLRSHGVLVSAIVTSGEASEACELFEMVAGCSVEHPIALVYVGEMKSDNPLANRLHRIEGASYVDINAEGRLFRNAIHAAITRETRSSADVIDLGAVLQEKRHSLRILVAEDNSTNQAIICQLLERAGHTVLLASDGEEALDRFEEDKPELALLDFNMPQRNGIEVVTAIRAMEGPNERLPVIILSASVTLEAREQASKAGADEFVGKPYEAANLLHVIDKLSRRVGKALRDATNADVGIGIAPVLLGALPLVDQARMRDVQRIATSADFFTQLLAGFEQDAVRILDQLELAKRNGQVEEVKNLMHGMRGAALGIGAQQLAARALAIETAAPESRRGQFDRSIVDLRRCLSATCHQLGALQHSKKRTLDSKVIGSRSLP